VSELRKEPTTYRRRTVKRLYRATFNSLHGFACAFKNEAAFREEMAAFVLALPFGVFVAPSAEWYVAMIGILLILMAIELLNTAIERLADHVTSATHPTIGLIKDYGSAAVCCTLLLAGLIWVSALAVRFGLVSP
jgi:diacylglycerol kinase (ATP)